MGKEGKCFNCNKDGQFARDWTEPRKVLPDFNSSEILVFTHVMVAHSHPYWIVDLGATKHISRDQVGFIEYHRIPKGVKNSTWGIELACKCRTLAPTSRNCTEDAFYCCMMFSILRKFGKTYYQLLSV